MSLIIYSHHAQGVPCAEVYRINPELSTSYPDLSFRDIGEWVMEKEKSLGGWGDRYLKFDDWGYLSFHYHVLKRAKVNYLDWVHEINSWGASYKKKAFRSHKDVCMEMFGEVADQETAVELSGDEVIALYECEGLSEVVVSNLFKLSDEEHHRVLDEIKRIRGTRHS